MSESPTLSRLLKTVRIGRRIVSDERAAFEAFRSRLSNLDSIGAAGQTQAALRTETRTVATARTEAAYRETVMSVPHYHSEYNQTYTRNVVTMLGPDVARALVESSRIESSTVETIHTVASERVEERDRMIDAIDVEHKSVREIADRLADGRETVDRRTSPTPASRSLEGLRSARERLKSIRRTCERSADERRRHCRRNRVEWPGDHETARAFCYRQYDSDEPVLAAIVSLARDVRARRECVERTIEHRLAGLTDVDSEPGAKRTDG